MIEEIFQDFGLTSYETKVYLALVKTGEASTGQILDEARIHSGKIYQILNSLKNRGFVSEVIKNGVRKYFPTKPDELIEHFEEKKKEIDSRELAFKKILPKLNEKIQKAKKEVHIEIFTGLEGMKKAFQKEKERYGNKNCLRINGIIDYNKHPKKVVDFFRYTLFSEREKSKIEIKKIVDINASKNEVEKQAKIKHLNYSSLVTFNTISDLVIVSIWIEDPLFFVIESDEVAKGFRENFELLWKQAKK